MAEKIGTISNRVFIKKLDQALQNGSISKKEYDSIKKEYFGKPKIIQMDLFDSDKKKQGGLMEATKRLKAQGLKSGGIAKKRPKKAGPPAKKTGPRSPIGPVPRMPRGMTNQEKLDMINKMKKDQGKMVDESLKVDNFGNFYYEVKKGGRIKKFPDLSGDGKVKPGSKAAKRRKSFCARSAGQMKKFPKAAADPNSRLRQARRRWKC